MHLHVYDKPQIDYLKLHFGLLIDPLKASLVAHNQSYIEGEQLSLTCLVDSYTPVKIQWRKDGKNLPSNSSVIIEGIKHLSM